MFTNGLIWMFYGLFIKNWFVFLANILSLPLSLFYLNVTLPLETNLSKRLHFTYGMMFGSTLVFFVASVCFIQVSRQVALQILGWTGSLIVVVLYGSPLASVYSVIKTKNASSINIYISLTSLINSCLWLVYGAVCFVFLLN